MIVRGRRRRGMRRRKFRRRRRRGTHTHTHTQRASERERERDLVEYVGLGGVLVEAAIELEVVRRVVVRQQHLEREGKACQETHAGREQHLSAERGSRQDNAPSRHPSRVLSPRASGRRCQARLGWGEGRGAGGGGRGHTCPLSSSRRGCQAGGCLAWPGGRVGVGPVRCRRPW
jgi:hypothetical protein